MRNFWKILVAAIVLPAIVSCGEKGPEQGGSGKPVAQILIKEISSRTARAQINLLNCSGAMVAVSNEVVSPSAEWMNANGTHVEGTSFEYRATELSPNTGYVMFVLPIGTDGKTLGNIESQSFFTPEDGMLPELPALTDMVLCYGGSEHRGGSQTAPFKGKWTKERFAPLVTYVDENGKESWLFESFLAIEFCDTKNGKDYGAGSSGNPPSRKSADKASWEYLMDYWFAEDNGFDALDKAIDDAIKRIGTPKSPRYVIMTLPDPIIHELFPDTTSPTDYWGSINGQKLDFAKAEDRRAAEYWFIEEVRKRFSEAQYHNIQLIGFYIISEDISIVYNGVRYGWSVEIKRNEELFPQIPRYLDQYGLGLYWIPYYLAGGYQLWNDPLEVDMAIMQPNHFWDTEGKKPMDKFFEAISIYNMGMEWEFDDALLGSSTEALEYKARFRDYLNKAKLYGVYGKKPFALYHGDNTFYNLYKSNDPTDQALFKEFCEFILENPMKKY